MATRSAWWLVSVFYGGDAAGVLVTSRTPIRRRVLARVKTFSGFGQADGGGVRGRHFFLEGTIAVALCPSNALGGFLWIWRWWCFSVVSILKAPP